MGRRPFEDVITEHGPTVLRVCRALLGYQEAEDAWSETFLAALRAYPDLEPGANVEAWLVTIAKHKAVDHHRAAGRRPRPAQGVPERPSPEGATLEDRDRLWSALRTLTARQREAVVYHHLAGLPYAEVAEILGGTDAAARRAAADGLRKLRSIYQGDPR